MANPNVPRIHTTDSSELLSQTKDPSELPRLLEEYRERSAGLQRLRHDVLAAGDREASEIVAAARAEIARVVLKARRDLVVLATQVRTVTDPGEAPRRGPEGLPRAGGPVDAAATDDHHRSHVLSWLDRAPRHVLREARPDLAALSSQAGELRSLLVAPRPSAAADVQPGRVPGAEREEQPDPGPKSPPADPAADVTTPPRSVETTIPSRTRLSRRGSMGMAAILGVAALVATALGGFWSSTGKEKPAQQTVGQPTAGTAGPASGATALQPEQTSGVGSGTGLSMGVETTRPVWMRVTVDGRVTSARLFAAGETEHISAARDASIRAGDAGAVLVSMSGGPAKALGRDGQVVTRHFAAREPDRRTAPAAPPSPAGSGPARPSDAAPAIEPATEDPALGSAAPFEAGAEREVVSEPPAPREAGAEREVSAESPAPSEGGAESVQGELAAATERWLEAYHAQDRLKMAALSSTDIRVSDERPVNERLPRGLSGVQRTLASVRVQVSGSEAVLTAELTERGVDPQGDSPVEAVSSISETWTRRDGEWLLNEIRIVGRVPGPGRW